MSLQLRCEECNGVEDRNPDAYCRDCWDKRGTEIHNLESQVEGLHEELNELAERCTELEEKLELEANVYAQEVAQWRERVRLLEERLCA